MKNLNQSKIRFLLLALFLMLFSLSALYSQSTTEQRQKKIISELRKGITSLELITIQIDGYATTLLNSLNEEKRLRLEDQKELDEEKALNLQMNGQLLDFKMVIVSSEQSLTDSETAFKNLKISITKDKIKLGFIVGGVTFGVTVLIAVPLTIYLYDKYFVNKPY